MRRTTLLTLLVLVWSSTVAVPGHAAPADELRLDVLTAGADIAWLDTAQATITSSAVGSTLSVTGPRGTVTVHQSASGPAPSFQYFDLAGQTPTRLDEPVTVVLDPDDSRRYEFALSGYRVRLGDDPGVVTGRVGPGETADVGLTWSDSGGSIVYESRTVTGAPVTGQFVADFRFGGTTPYAAPTWLPGTSAYLMIEQTDTTATLRLSLHRSVPVVLVETENGDHADAAVEVFDDEFGRVDTIGDGAYLSGGTAIASGADLTAGVTVTAGRFRIDVADAPLAITTVDRSTRTLSGTGPPGSSLYVAETDETGTRTQMVPVTGAGTWSQSFGSAPGGTVAWVDARVQVTTTDGIIRSDRRQSGVITAREEDYEIGVDVRHGIDIVSRRLVDFGADLEVTITAADGSHTATATSVREGGAYEVNVGADDFVPPVDLAQGGTVTLSGPQGTVSLLLPRLGDVSLNGARVSGITEPSGVVDVGVVPPGSMGGSHHATVVADATGAFAHDFGIAAGPGTVFTAATTTGTGSVFASFRGASPAEVTVPVGVASVVPSPRFGPSISLSAEDVPRTVRIGAARTRFASLGGAGVASGVDAALLSLDYEVAITENGAAVRIPSGDVGLYLPLLLEVSQGGGVAPPSPAFPFVGFEAGNGWEAVSPDLVTWCVDGNATDLADVCGDYPMPFAVVSPLPHASRFAAFAANPAGPLDVDRVAGVDRVATSVALSQETFERADWVVIATSEKFPDALAAAPLAAAWHAPVLLTPQAALAPAVGDEIDRLGATHAWVMGGKAALSDDVVAAVEDRPAVASVERLAGVDRFGTAARAAEVALSGWQADGFTEVGHEVIVALGAYPGDDNRAWPDALAAGPLAAAAHRPILLTAPDQVPAATQDLLDLLPLTRVTVVGGAAAIPDATMNELGPSGTARERIGGTTRYHTGILLADAAVRAGATDRDVILATGQNWPDGLAAGAAVAARSGVLVLAPSADLDAAPEVTTWLGSHNEVSRWVRLAGGAAALSDMTRTQITDLLD